MTPIQLPTLGYFKNGNGYLGSAGALRFQIERPQEGQMTVALWQGPYSRPYAQELARETFPVDGPGLDALSAYLNAQAQAIAQSPPFSPQELEDYYQSKKAEE